MKKIFYRKEFLAPLLLVIIHTQLISQVFNIVNFTHTDYSQDFLYQDSIMLVATHGGIVKLNLVNEKMEVLYTTSNGLSDNECTGITKIGNDLWIASKDGISKFNTQSSLIFSEKDGLSSKEIRKIIAASDGSLWAATANGLSRFKTNQWTSYTMDDGLSHNMVRDIMENKDSSIWAATDNGLSFFKNEKWQSFPLNDSLAHKWIYALGKDTAGNIWAGTRLGLSKIKDDTVYNFTVDSGLIDNWIVSLAIDSLNRVWCGTWYGISIYNHVSWENHGMETGLIDTQIVSLYTDPTGIIWVGTPSGFGKYQENTYQFYSLPGQIPTNKIESVTSETNKIWAATDKGATYLENGKWNLFQINIDPPLEKIKTIYKDNNNILWFGADYGNENTDTSLVSYDGLNWKAYNIYPDVTQVIKQDQQGWLWFGSPEGIYYYTSASQKMAYFHEFTDPNVKDIEFDNQGNMWLANSGVDKYNKVSLKNYNTSDGLPSNDVNAIAIDSHGNPWCATSNGVAFFQNNTWVQYSTQDGLANPVVNDIEIDSKNNIWMATSNGISIFNGNNWITLGKKSGLVDEICRNIYFENDTTAWISTYGGISKINFQLPEASFYTGTSFVMDDENVSPRLYPNPANNYLNIKNQGKLIYFEVYNIQGEFLSSGEIQEQFLLNTSDLPGGIYFIKFSGSNLNETKKFVVAH